MVSETLDTTGQQNKYWMLTKEQKEKKNTKTKSDIIGN